MLDKLLKSTAIPEPEDASDLASGFYNSTDEALLSHVDAPSDSLYMIFGVLIAMVLVAVIIILLAITISKLRKREDHSSATPAPPTDVVLHTSAAVAATPTVLETSATTTSLTTPPTPTSDACTPQFLGLWQQPPQYTLYPNDKETLVQPMPVERPKFARGIRKNLSGRWKRLTKKKNPTNEVYTIPADLRDQLKSIYVY